MQAKVGTPELPFNDAGTDLSPAGFTNLRALFDEVSHEWAEMISLIQDLKRRLETDDFMAILRSARLEAVCIDHLGPDSVLDLDSSTAFYKEQEEEEVGVKKGVVAGVGVEGVEEIEEAIHGNKDEPDRGEPGAIHDKLNQLLHLLKEGMAAKTAEDGPWPMQVSRNLAHEIAQEVAGRFRESMLSTVRHKIGDLESGVVKPAPEDSAERHQNDYCSDNGTGEQ